MQIREAILKAADSIEANPDLFDFEVSNIPPCGSPACMFGWIGIHTGLPTGTLNVEVSRVVFGESKTGLFYSEIMQISHDNGHVGIWENPLAIAESMRIYADRHYPLADHIPESVRAIFKEQVSS